MQLAVVLKHLVDLKIPLHQLLLKLHNVLFPVLNHLIQVLQIFIQPLNMTGGMGQPVLQLMIIGLGMRSGLDHLLHGKDQIQRFLVQLRLAC
ncbi:hypothetical protein D3C74_430920 [compost metagenome]